MATRECACMSIQASVHACRCVHRHSLMRKPRLHNNRATPCCALRALRGRATRSEPSARRGLALCAPRP
eukprot:1784721-Alexandrium_andersonii.AAC.1